MRWRSCLSLCTVVALVTALVVSVEVAFSSATARGGDIYVAGWGGTIGEYTTSGAVVNASLVSGLDSLPGIAVSGSNLFVTSWGLSSGTIGEYTTSGAVVNASLVSGLSDPWGIAVSGSNLFVANWGSGTIGEYTTSGAVVNASLISGLNAPSGIAVSGSNLFVVNYGSGTIGEYTTSGAVVNASLVSGLNSPDGIAVSGSNLFVTSFNRNTIGEYTTSGAVVNASLVSGLGQPAGIAVSGSNLFVANYDMSTIGEYTTSGAVVNASLISGADSHGIAVVPKPTTVALTAVSNATIITGGTGNLGTTVSNSGAFDADNLNYTLSAVVQSGSATLGTITSGTGSLAPSSSQSCTVTVTSTNVGNNTISITASDPNASNSPQTTTGTLTVLGHSNPALTVTSGNNQSVFIGASSITAGFNLTDSGTNLSPLDVNSLSSGLSGGTGTAVIACGGSATYTATLSTSAAGSSQSQSFSLKAGDEQSLSGANALGTLTQSITGLSVYNHATGALSGGTTLTIPTVIVGYANSVSSNLLTVSNTTVSPGGALKTTGSTSLSDVMLNNVNNVLAGGGTGSLSATLATGQGVGTFSQSSLTLTYADASTYSGALSNLGTATVTITGDVLGHSNPALTVTSGNNQSAFIGATGITAGLTLTDSGTNISPLDVNSLSSGLTGTTGTGVIACGSSGMYTGTLSTGTAGLSQGQSFSLKAGDEQALSGANALGTLTQSVTGMNVYNHAAGALSGGTTLTIPTVIMGYGSPVNSNLLTVSNTAASPGGALKTTGSMSLSNVTFNNVNSIVANGGTGSLSATLAVGQGVGAFTQSGVTLTYADASTYSGALSNLGTATVTITGDVLGHSNPALAIAAGNNQTIITGGTLGAVILNLTDAGTNLSALDVNTLSNLSGGTGMAVVSNGGTGVYTATGFNTTTVGPSETLFTSLKAGDQQSLSGHNALAQQSQNVTYSVLGHSNPALTITSGNNQTVIAGATNVSASLSLTDSGTNLSPLDVNNLSSGLSGGTGSAVVLSGSTGNYTATLNTGTIGMAQTQSFSLQAGDQQTLSGANALNTLNQTVTLNVLGHATPSLSVQWQQSTVIVGATGIITAFSLANGNLNQNGLAALDVNSLGVGVNGGTGGALIPSGSSQSYTADLNTGMLGTHPQAFSLNVGDDHTLPGASAPTNLSLTATLTVLGHAAPNLSVVSGNNQTVIVGASGINAGLEPVQWHAQPKRPGIVGCQFTGSTRLWLDGRRAWLHPAPFSPTRQPLAPARWERKLRPSRSTLAMTIPYREHRRQPIFRPVQR